MTGKYVNTYLWKGAGKDTAHISDSRWSHDQTYVSDAYRLILRACAIDLVLGAPASSLPPNWVLLSLLGPTAH